MKERLMYMCTGYSISLQVQWVLQYHLFYTLLII